MLYDVHLLDTQTQDRGIYRWDDLESTPVTFDAWIWEEGNFACDCNRGDFLARALGRPDPDLSCADTNRIKVERIVRVSTGEQVYQETI